MRLWGTLQWQKNQWGYNISRKDAELWSVLCSLYIFYYCCHQPLFIKSLKTATTADVILSTFPDKIRYKRSKRSGQEESRALPERGWSQKLIRNRNGESNGSEWKSLCGDWVLAQQSWGSVSIVHISFLSSPHLLSWYMIFFFPA